MRMPHDEICEIRLSMKGLEIGYGNGRGIRLNGILIPDGWSILVRWGQTLRPLLILGQS